jgi:putative ABC transport system permease protein
MLSDLRYIGRSLVRTKGFTVITIITLALGIGSAAAIFRAVDWVLFRANAFPAGLYLIGTTDKSGQSNTGCIDAQARAYRELSNVFCEHGMAAWRQVNVSIAGSPVITNTVDISSNVLPLLGIVPALGRNFLPGENVEGRNQVVVIGHHFWKTHLGGSPDVLGQKIVVGKAVCTAVGVLKEGQSLPPNMWSEVYRPLAYTVDPARPWDPFLMVLIQLQPGVTRPAAEAVMAGAKIDWPARWDPSARELKPTLTSLTELQKWNHPEIYWMLFGAVGFLYGIACLNATNLLLVRQLGRKRELSIRLALGGGRWSVIRLLLLESIVLSLVSSAAGLVVANWLSLLFAALGGNKLQLSWSSLVGIDWRTFAVLAAVTVLTSVAIVVVPAFGVWRLDIQAGLKDGGGAIGESRRLARLRGLLVVLQVAFAIILLTGAGLMVRTFHKLQDVKFGFETDRRIKVLVSFPSSYPAENEPRLALIRRLEDHLRHVPNVADVAYGSDNLMAGYYYPYQPIRTADGTSVKVVIDTFSPNYREVTGVVLKRGQWFGGTSQSEIMINDALARRLFGDKDPVGQPVRPEGAAKEWKGWTVVGVVGDMRETVRGAPGYHIFFPLAWSAQSVSTYILRLTHASDESFEGTVRRAIYAFDPDIVTDQVTPLAETRYRNMYHERFALSVLEVLSATALFLTIVGLFSVLAYTVDRRMSEFGVRLALGATARDLMILIIGRGVLFTGIGIVGGIAGALALARFLRSLLYETPPYDPVVLGAVSVLLVLSAVAASVVPAFRATRADVSRLLRAE